MKIRFDGKEYEVGSEEHVLAMTRKIDGLETLIEEKDKEKSDLCAQKEKTDAERDEALAKVADIQKKLDEANDPKRLDAAVSERVALIVSAKQLLGEDYKFDSADAETIMKDAILKIRPEKKLDGKSVEYVRATFDALVESGARADGIDAVPAVIASVAKKLDGDKEPVAKTDSNEPHWDAVKG